MSELDFDMQAAWLRRFSADAQSNLGAFALRLKEAMPALVTIQEKKGFFAKTGTITGVSIELGENRYQLELAGGRLQASIAMVVRGITLNTKTMDPAEWFARLAQETANASAHAQSLSASLQQFMAS
ncbi:hypothetical protein [Acidocella sp.]|uniref:hypothetical protein n=1 Tax=Acidocella sp. TaxID=50710 RepID=UPI0018158413|nr:hypothetical protein [Acidocella sp.]NNM58006.1 hypothetical protein [Acidocella sp.]